MGLRTSIYLTDELAAIWRASRLPAAEVFRRGLAAGGPVDETTLRHILREELAALPDCRATTNHGSAGYESGNYQSEPYLQDP